MTNSNTIESHEGNLREQLWESTKTLHEAVVKEGINAVAHTLLTPEELRGYYEEKGILQIFCVDERIVVLKDEEGKINALYVPGAGALENQDNFRDIVRSLASKKERVIVKSHPRCGAAALLAQQEGIPPEHSDDAGRDYAKELVKTLNDEGIENIEYGGDMLISPDIPLHDAKAVYYIGTNNFNPKSERSDKLLKGFRVSRKTLGKEAGKASLDLCLQIAFGDHGFSDLFTKYNPEGKDQGNPLVLIIVANESDIDTLNALRAEAEEVSEKYEGRVKVDILLEHSGNL